MFSFSPQNIHAINQQIILQNSILACIKKNKEKNIIKSFNSLVQFAFKSMIGIVNSEKVRNSSEDI